MFPPATKQETSPGPWIHDVNKYTEDFRDCKELGCSDVSLAPRSPAFLAEKRVQAAGQAGPARIHVFPEPSRLPDP